MSSMALAGLQAGTSIAQGFMDASSSRSQSRIAEQNIRISKAEGKIQGARLKNKVSSELALKNVLSAAQGRSGGSVGAIQNKLRTDLDKDIAALGLSTSFKTSALQMDISGYKHKSRMAPVKGIMQAASQFAGDYAQKKKVG